MNKPPKISIVLANYNNDVYLDDCLRSVSEQTFRDFECIVVDDGSTDNSKSIIKKWAKKDSRFKPIFQKNQGVSKARNVGLDKCTGDWIGFLDSDDCFYRNAMAILIEAAEQNHVDIVGGGGVRVPDDFKLGDASVVDDTNFANPPFMILDTSMTGIIKMEYVGEAHRFVWLWRRLFRKEVLAGVRFDEELWPGEDTCFILEALPHAQRVMEIKSMVVYHRLAQRSVSMAPYNQKSFSWIVPTLKRIRWILDKYYSPEYAKHYYKGYMEMVVFDLVVKTMSHRRMMPQAAQEIRKIYGTPVLPTKYLSWIKRLILWLFIKVF